MQYTSRGSECGGIWINACLIQPNFMFYNTKLISNIQELPARKRTPMLVSIARVESLYVQTIQFSLFFYWEEDVLRAVNGREGKGVRYL